MNAVLTPAEIDKGYAILLFSAEDADELSLIGNHCAVEDPGNILQGISADHRILPVTPDGNIRNASF